MPGLAEVVGPCVCGVCVCACGGGERTVQLVVERYFSSVNLRHADGGVAGVWQVSAP